MISKDRRLRPSKEIKFQRSQTKVEAANNPFFDNQMKPFACPYEGCGKQFSESGNLKTHIRIHVNKTLITNRQESGLLLVSTKTVGNALLLKDI